MRNYNMKKKKLAGIFDKNTLFIAIVVIGIVYNHRPMAKHTIMLLNSIINTIPRLEIIQYKSFPFVT